MSSRHDLSESIMKDMDRFVHLNSIADLKFVTVKNLDNIVVMSYEVKDRDLKSSYSFELHNALIANKKNLRWQMPVLKLLTPVIKPNVDIHLLGGNKICYVFPGDILYNKGITCGYAIEQSFKWVFGYEFYLKENYWPFSEMPHGIYPNQWGFYRPYLVA